MSEERKRTGTRKPAERRGGKGFRHASEMARGSVDRIVGRKGFAESEVLLRWAEIVGDALATACRKRKRILRRNRAERNRGRFVQVSRLAWPLVNEVLVPLKDKDKFNRSRPRYDLDNIGSYVLFPELTGLLTAVLGLGCTPTPAEGRTDIAGLLSPNGTTIADLLRINVAAGQGPGFN